jgi:hypothetical protein
MSHEANYTRVIKINEVNLAGGAIDLKALKQARNMFLEACKDEVAAAGAGELKINGEDWEVSAVLSQQLVLLKRGVYYMLAHVGTILPTYAQAIFASDPQANDNLLVNPIDEQRIQAIEALLPWVMAMESELQA